MAFDPHVNFAYGTLSNSPGTGGTSFIVQTGEGANFGSDFAFNATVWPVGVQPINSNAEIVRVTARASDTLTVTRTQEGTSAKNVTAGYQIAMTITDKVITDIENAAGGTVRNQVPGGSVNGSNTAFTTSSTFATGSLRVYQNGIRLKGGGEDFTENAALNGFTMVTAPATGDILLVDYELNSSQVMVGTNSFISSETPTGSVNGSNTAFTVAQGQYVAGSLNVFVNGVRQARTTHFTETTPGSGAFTMSDAPATGDILRVDYQYGLSNSGNADTVDGIHANATATANQILPLNANSRYPNSVNTTSGCELKKSAAQSLTTGTITAATFDQENWDSDGYHSTSSNTSRITIPSGFDGKFLFVANAAFDTNTTGARFAWFGKNGTSTNRTGLMGGSVPTSNDYGVTLSATYDLVAGDYIELFVFQSSGGALNLKSEAEAIGYTRFSVIRLGA